VNKRTIFLVIGLLILTFLLSACTKDTDVEPISDVWGIQLSAREVTPTGMTLICQQSGGEPTGDLHTGSYYSLEKKVKEDWVEVEGLDVGWTTEAWPIPMNDTIKWEVDWEWLYGELPIGRYRIGKGITDFRETGDYDTRMYYVIFEIEV